MQPLYCQPSDLYAFGLPRGAIPNEGRLLAAVSVSADTLTLDVHGLAENQAFSLRVEAGGTMPGGLAPDTTYYAHPLDESRFQARATPSGSIVDITSSGDAERVLVIVPLDVPSWIRFASRLIDEMVPAHAVPLVKVDAAGKREDEAGYDSSTGEYPEIITITCAELASGKGLGFGGNSSRTLAKAIDDARKRLDKWAAGVPVRGAPGQTPTNLATSAAVPYRDPRGWNQYGGT